MAAIGIDYKFLTMNPKILLLLSALSKARESRKKDGKTVSSRARGSYLVMEVFSVLCASCDINGEVEASNIEIAKLVESTKIEVGGAIKLLKDNGLIEYKVRRCQRGNLFRINPDVLTYQTRLFQRAVKKTETDMETGEYTERMEVTSSESKEFMKLKKRYGGEKLNLELIKHRIERIKKSTDTVNTLIQAD